MGCSSSFQVSNNIPGQGQEVMVYANKHHMTKHDVDSIFRRFKEFDVRRNNLVDVDEFVVGLGLQPEIFLVLVFRLFDQDMDGSLTFVEFMMAFYQFLTLDKDSLAMFTFGIFDLSGDGELNREELMFMMSILEGKNGHRGRRRMSTHVTEASNERNDKLAYNELDIDGDGNVSILEFLSLIKRRSSMMFLAFETQLVLRNSCLSEKRWDELTTRRENSMIKSKSGNPTFEGIASMMGWDEHKQRCSSEYAFLALKGLPGLPPLLKNKVEEVDQRVKLARAEIMKKRQIDLVLNSSKLNNQGKTKGQQLQQKVSSNYEAMHETKAGATDNVGARHTHTHLMTLGSGVNAVPSPHSGGVSLQVGDTQGHEIGHIHKDHSHSHKDHSHSHKDHSHSHKDHSHTYKDHGHSHKDQDNTEGHSNYNRQEEHNVRTKPSAKVEYGKSHKVGHGE